MILKHYSLSKLKSAKGDVNINNFWKLKQRIFPQARDASAAKYDSKGHLITSGGKLKDLYLQTYQERLKHRTIKEGLEKHQERREEIFELRKNEAKDKIKKPWTMEQLLKVLKSLKKGKARDPLNLVNEIFRPEVAGKDLQLALLKLANKINEEQTFPELLKYTDITSVYKGKGSRADMDNQRGLFSLVTIRTIIDKLIYQDEYENIDKNLTDCNVGARKERNIRDNLFVVNGVINAVINGDDDPIDVELFDVKKCFDTLWMKECLNDLYEAGLTSSNLNLIYEGNKECFLSVKAPTGLTKRVKIEEIVMQGSVWGPLCCTSTMDKIGKKAYRSGSPLYTYKGLVSVPPLGMVDDEITMAKCSVDSTKTNTFMNTFTEMKKLEFGIKKCHKMHVGPETNLCEDIKVHEGIGTKVVTDKYVGDIIANDGSNTEKIKERCDRGFGIINDIMSILEELPLGPYHIPTGIKLREAMLLNGLLFNSECWYNLKESEVDKLSAIDEQLLRKILKTPSKTCKESLFLETGCKPVKFLIMQRRLMYHHHILRRPKNELISKFYHAQKLKPSKGDFVNLVDMDKKLLKINLTDDQISSISDSKYKEMIKKAISEETFKYLINLKKKHSKMDELNYSELKIQNYLKSSNGLTHDEKCTLFKFRVREIDVKTNYRNRHQNLQCELCQSGEDDSQLHLLNCQKLIENCETLANNIEVEYEDIFEDIESQAKAVRLLTEILEVRTQLFENED